MDRIGAKSTLLVNQSTSARGHQRSIVPDPVGWRWVRYFNQYFMKVTFATQ